MKDAARVGIALVVVAGILVLTRPGSQGPGLVTAITGGFSSAVQSAAGTTSGAKVG